MHRLPRRSTRSTPPRHARRFSLPDAAIRLRRLGRGDVAGLRALNAVFGQAFEDPDTHDPARVSDAWLADLLERDDFVALIAEAGNELVAGLTAYQLRKYEREASEFYIYDLAVLEAWRRRGIATALIDRLRRIAAEKGGWVIFVQADYVDPPAIALYEKLGRREEVLHFDIDPAPREGPAA